MVNETKPLKRNATWIGNQGKSNEGQDKTDRKHIQIELMMAISIQKHQQSNNVQRGCPEKAPSYIYILFQPEHKHHDSGIGNLYH